MILAISAVLVWYFILHVGTIIIRAEAPFEVLLVDNRRFQCSENPCSLRVTADDYEAVLSKTGFYDIEQTINVPMLDTVEIDANFVLIPFLDEVAPEVFPKPPKVELPPPHFFNASQQIIMEPDERGQGQPLLPFRSSNKDLKIYASPSQEWLVVEDTDAVYIVDKNKLHKKRIDSSKNSKSPIIWNEAEQQVAYLSADNNVVIYNWNTQQRNEIPFGNFPLLFTWYNNEQILFVTPAAVGFADTANQEIHYLLSNFEIDVSQDIVFQQDEHTVYFITTDGDHLKAILSR